MCRCNRAPLDRSCRRRSACCCSSGNGLDPRGGGHSARETLLEIARTHRLPGLCVVAFGAEEIGLFGSAAFVEQHDVAAASFMLNFDMTAKLSDNMRGLIGPCHSRAALWALVPKMLGVDLPAALVKAQLRRIEFHAEKIGTGWVIDLSRSRQLIAAAWGDD